METDLSDEEIGRRVGANALYARLMLFSFLFLFFSGLVLSVKGINFILIFALIGCALIFVLCCIFLVRHLEKQVLSARKESQIQQETVNVTKG